MSDLVIKAASWLGAEGFGNDLVGLATWPAALGDALRRGELEELCWSGLFKSEAQRFARMDWLSRLGLMAVELLDARFETRDAQDREQTGICVETAAGCLASDAEFLRQPRPTVFTYTLPSMVIGEICIRHRFKGPMLCFMSSGQSTRAAMAEAAAWLREGSAKSCLCVGCEAVSPDAAALLPSDLALENMWQACALWLGRKSDDPREQALGQGTLTETCRHLCRAASRCQTKPLWKPSLTN
jgi:3-oxoacyl-(acyl-carrier-protein) synthase